MVAINKRPVRLLCSPNPPRESRSLFLHPVPSSFRVASFPLSLSPRAFSPSPLAPPEFPALVISEPCEERVSRRRKYFTSSAKEGKIAITLLLRFHISSSNSPSSDRACQRHCRIQERRGGERRRRGTKRERENHDGLCTFYEINS